MEIERGVVAYTGGTRYVKACEDSLNGSSSAGAGIIGAPVLASHTSSGANNNYGASGSYATGAPVGGGGLRGMQQFEMESLDAPVVGEPVRQSGEPITVYDGVQLTK